LSVRLKLDCSYLLKTSLPEIFLTQYESRKWGQVYDPHLAAEMLSRIPLRLLARALANLSDRELEVFKLLIAGLRVNEIAAQLFISDKTVSSHKKETNGKCIFPAWLS